MGTKGLVKLRFLNKTINLYSHYDGYDYIAFFRDQMDEYIQKYGIDYLINILNNLVIVNDDVPFTDEIAQYLIDNKYIVFYDHSPICICENKDNIHDTSCMFNWYNFIRCNTIDGIIESKYIYDYINVDDNYVDAKLDIYLITKNILPIGQCTCCLNDNTKITIYEDNIICLDCLARQDVIIFD